MARSRKGWQQQCDRNVRPLVEELAPCRQGCPLVTGQEEEELVLSACRLEAIAKLEVEMPEERDGEAL